MLGTSPAVCLFVLRPRFNLFFWLCVWHWYHEFVKSLTFNQSLINRSAVYCHLAETGSLFRHGASPESILNNPQQAPAEKFAGNFAPPPPWRKSLWLLYFRPKLNVKSPSSLFPQLLPGLRPSVSILPSASGPRGCAALCTLQKIAVSVSWCDMNGRHCVRWTKRAGEATRKEGSKHKGGQRWRGKQEAQKMSALMRKGGKSWRRRAEEKAAHWLQLGGHFVINARKMRGCFKNTNLVLRGALNAWRAKTEAECEPLTT